MSASDASVVLVHGAWADGSSWAKVIKPLAAAGIKVLAPSEALHASREQGQVRTSLRSVRQPTFPGEPVLDRYRV